MSIGILRGEVAIVGAGETKLYKHGDSPDDEFILALAVVLGACRDAAADLRKLSARGRA